MKTFRLVLLLTVSFFATAVCSILGDVVGDPCGEESPERYNQCLTEIVVHNATSDSIAALTQTQSVLNITYPANPALQPATLTPSPITIARDTETLTSSPIAQGILPSGAYQVDVSSGGRQFRSTWTLEVVNEVITGVSAWDCCPDPREDALSGTLIGEEVTIERDCSGQGFQGPCSQTYKGTFKGNTISGTITGTGIPTSGATWTLYLSP